MVLRGKVIEIGTRRASEGPTVLVRLRVTEEQARAMARFLYGEIEVLLQGGEPKEETP